MIDRYEGHTPDGWYVDDAIDVIHPTVIHSNKTDNIIAELVMANAEDWTEEDYANARLIADAPDLLAEVEQLRKRNDWLEEVVALLQEEGLDLSEGYPLWEESE